MQKKIDCRGLACPGPVINIKKEIDSGYHGILEIIVDNKAALKNVTRFIKSQDKTVEEVLENGNIITIIASLGSNNGEYEISKVEAEDNLVIPNNSGVTYVIGSDVMGRGDDILGRKLFVGFLNNLPEIEPLPKTIFFYNSGINFTQEGSFVLESLIKLEKKGVEIITCGTCTEFHGVTETLSVGIVGNLYDLTTLFQRDRVITL